ncbi:hypothetical protein HMPREF0290_2828 [Corynebacterium efficiens YS-314]|uniref:G domain-containing protein n=1 Tax=Corynebacterium efficiens (strain DSM 44549 / YS-314 / AJ 12310 / JCM 11189 / NBRC 100395) TaxID=196164 RepID=Q8FLL3_COREF|nr:GTPase domain-containing protein [Corynebacterium efficiens]EEW48516.1 hypothetical protein HMPREF0290_2828 [Corynebacterium efficiens YS-314]BAC19665.1 hypothetical protein [Corynebacterium efficiens YS-314]
MTSASAVEYQAWIREVSGESDFSRLASEWGDFAAEKQSVLTLFGAFDTGKSSILRRLLVDAGQPLPEWLTISARHETFAENAVRVNGCLIRDTPGLSPEGLDARSLSNSDIARSALGRTDVLLVTLNPQLSTGEHTELVNVLSHGWPKSDVWFLISRADEGGVDPTLDPEEFEAWSARKREELKQSLKLVDSARIFVLVPDFAGLGAYESNPTPSLWDPYRDWDGMAELTAALDDLAAQDLSPYRHSAELRFWRKAVISRIGDVQTSLDDLRVACEVADVSRQRRDSFLNQIDSLTSAAEASLAGVVEDAIQRAASRPEVDADSIRSAVDPVLDEWWQRQQAGLARIRQEAIQGLEQQREGQGWARFESVYLKFTQPESLDPEGKSSVVPKIEALSNKVASALHGVDRVLKSDQAVKSPKKSADLLDATKKQSLSKLALAAGIAEAALPVVLELAAMVEEKVQAERDRALQRDHREKVRAAVSNVVTDVACEAMRSLETEIDGLRHEVIAQTVDEAEVVRLNEASSEARSLLERGKKLISQ